MTAITFDTLKFVRTLRDADFDEKQAEAISRAFKDAQDGAELATKVDLRDLAHRLTIRMGTMIAAAVVVITALDKLV
uniref:DUF1640 domain-containing protein n=1 Tax=Candidatus Kentrum sp. DK TaxID=2126562 RepID=A0A450T6Y8_9GAMM|nr:MAG: hypothetical protein BECKDK2373B_GA0170837_11112 [Candidatus Kentron sp. DK]VFJ68523.1 MAG: hypothetical protein BECKDK2373C_GA0170839_11863 [Candidatus Kentron sp. DK]